MGLPFASARLGARGSREIADQESFILLVEWRGEFSRPYSPGRRESSAFILRMTWPRRALTVISLKPSSPPSCLFRRPHTTRAITSRSWLVSDAHAFHLARHGCYTAGRVAGCRGKYSFSGWKSTIRSLETSSQRPETDSRSLDAYAEIQISDPRNQNNGFLIP
jgi:hypothetical protein